MAYTVADCQRIIDAVKRTRRCYMLAENCCYWPFIRQWKRWIDEGRIGEVFYAEAEYIHNIQELLRDRESGEAYWRLHRPPIVYCSHSLGPLLYLTEDRIVSACGAHCGTGIMPDLGPGCLNMEVALFKTQKGAVIKLLRSQVAYRPSIHYYSLYGTQGCLETDRIGGWGDRTGLLHAHGKTPAEQFEAIDCPIADPDAPPEALAGGHGTAEYALVRDFVAAVQAGVQPPIDAVWGASFTAPGLVAHQSAQSGEGWLDVHLFSW